MWLFGRKKTTSDKVPEEVQEYYQSERRERVGIAWLLALGTLVATVVIAIGLFFGGRWTWHKIAGNGDKPTTTQQEDQKPGQQTSQTDQNQPENTPSSNVDQSPSSTPATSTSPPSSTPQTNAATPAQSAQPITSTNLTNTGPGDTVAIFIGTTIVGIFAHQVYTRRKLTRDL